MKTTILIILILASAIEAKVLISPIDAMKSCYGQDTKIGKKNIMLKRGIAKKVMKKAQVKLKSKIFKIFIAKKNTQIVGYGILINRKVRSKNAVVLYMIDISSKLKAMEIIAFNEPTEYLPSKKWEEQFKDVETSQKLQLNKNISTITGATMTARTITDGSRLAFAFYEEMLK